MRQFDTYPPAVSAWVLTMRTVVHGRDCCRLPLSMLLWSPDRVIVTGDMHLQHLMSISCNCNYSESVTSLHGNNTTS
jgi:hypothetical protein